MDEQDSKKGALVLLFVIAILILGAGYVHRHSDARKAVEQTVDVFVPDAEEFNRRTAPVDQARQLADAINAGQVQQMEQARRSGAGR